MNFNSAAHGIAGFTKILLNVTFASKSSTQQLLNRVLPGWACDIERRQNTVDVDNC